MHNNHKNKEERGKLRNMKLTLMYDGGRYFGWQRLCEETKEKTIQGILENQLSILLNENIKIIGAGRTDAGVHALGQVANFHTASSLGCKKIRENINNCLPEDIRIVKIEEVPDKFHSRYDAIGKIYEYHLVCGEQPFVFLRKYSVNVPYMMDISKMEKGAEFLIGTHDFSGFSSHMKDRRNRKKTIYEIAIQEEKGHVIVTICGNGFLYNMVRIIVGTLVEIGQGIKEPKIITQILRTKDRNLAGKTMESKGLFLKRVWYREGKVGK